MERIQEELRDGVVPPPHPGLITVGSCHGPESQRVGEPWRNFRDELWALPGQTCGLWSKNLVSSLHPSGSADGNSRSLICQNPSGVTKPGGRCFRARGPCRSEHPWNHSDLSVSHRPHLIWFIGNFPNQRTSRVWASVNTSTGAPGSKCPSFPGLERDSHVEHSCVTSPTSQVMETKSLRDCTGCTFLLWPHVLTFLKLARVWLSDVLDGQHRVYTCHRAFADGREVNLSLRKCKSQNYLSTQNLDKYLQQHYS